MYKGFGDFTTTGGSTEGLYEPDGSLQTAKAKALARTYAWAYQGTPTSMYFSTEDSSFTTTFELNSTVVAPTEIFAHLDYWYSQGYKISVETTNGLVPAVSFDKDASLNSIAINFTDAKELQDLNGQKIQVLLTPALTATEGSVSDKGYAMTWTITDSSSGQCPFEVTLPAGLGETIALNVYSKTGIIQHSFRAAEKE